MSRTSSDYCLPLLIAETSVCSMAAVSGFERSFKRAAMSVGAEAEGDAEEPEELSFDFTLEDFFGKSDDRD